MQELGASDIDEPIRLLMGTKPDVVFYGCTSATLTHGPEFDRDLARIIDEKSNAATVTAAGALVYSLEHLNIKRIGFASPYVSAINDMAIGFLKTMGVETVARSEVAETLDNEGQGALTPDRVLALGLKADHPEAEALVLSCTDMRSVEIISALEKAVGKPVITSNQAMMFQALKLIGHQHPVRDFGTLLEQVGS